MLFLRLHQSKYPKTSWFTHKISMICTEISSLVILNLEKNVAGELFDS